MERNSVRTLLVLAALCITQWPALAHAGAAERLFFIERSTNKNRVSYDVQRTASGQLDLRMPIVAYWLMLEERGQREELTWFERDLAYGYEVLPPVTPAAFRLKLVGYDKRSVLVRRVGSRYQAELVILGRRALLHKLYIKARPGWIHPIVEYIELVGHDPSTGARLVERIAAD